MSADTQAARELYLYTISDGDLYRSQGEPIIKNLARKRAKGIFQHAKAVKLYTYLADSAAKKYTWDFDVRQPGVSRWQQVKGYGIFSTATRRAAAELLLDYYEEQIDALSRVMQAKGK